MNPQHEVVKHFILTNRISVSIYKKVLKFIFNLADICDIIHKESIGFRTTKEQLIQKINCSE